MHFCISGVDSIAHVACVEERQKKHPRAISHRLLLGASCEKQLSIFEQVCRLPYRIYKLDRKHVEIPERKKTKKQKNTSYITAFKRKKLMI